MNLEPAPWSVVPDILSILLKRWPDSKLGYYCLKHIADDFKLLKSQFVLLTPNGKVDEYGTFIIVRPGGLFAAILETFNLDLVPLTNAIADCQFVGWNKKSCVTWGPVHERHFPILDSLVDIVMSPKNHYTETISYHLSIENAKAITVKIPDDVSVDLLKEENAKTVNDVWPHASGEESRLTLEDLIRMEKAYGLFKKESGKLVSWCFILPYEGPAILQTSDDEKGKGYGEAILRFVTKKLGDRGIEPQAFIVKGNKISLKLFTKLGYKPDYIARWYNFINS